MKASVNLDAFEAELEPSSLGGASVAQFVVKTTRCQDSHRAAQAVACHEQSARAFLQRLRELVPEHVDA